MAKKNLFDMIRNSRDNGTVTPVKEEPVAEGKPSFVMEELSLEDVYYSKTFTFRMDTLLMAAVLSCVLLVISFLLGRFSVSQPEPVKMASPALVTDSDKVDEKSLEEVGEKMLTEKGIGKNTGGTKSNADKSGNYHLQILTSPTHKGAQDVVDFLSKHGLKAFVENRGRHHLVRIGGFEKVDNSFRDKIRKMTYKGRNWFRTAYFVKVS